MRLPDQYPGGNNACPLRRIRRYKYDNNTAHVIKRPQDRRASIVSSNSNTSYRAKDVDEVARDWQAYTFDEKCSYGARLIGGLVSVIIERGKKGITINTIAARSNMPDGLRIMKHAGFTEIESLTPERRTFVINVKQSGIPFIMEYKEALKEAISKNAEQYSHSSNALPTRKHLKSVD